MVAGGEAALPGGGPDLEEVHPAVGVFVLFAVGDAWVRCYCLLAELLGEYEASGKGFVGMWWGQGGRHRFLPLPPVVNWTSPRFMR